MKDLKDKLESQSMIDEIVVNNSDNIALMKKIKEKNEENIKHLETKIEVLHKELEARNKEFKNLDQPQIMKVNERQLKNEPIVCK